MRRNNSRTKLKGKATRKTTNGLPLGFLYGDARAAYLARYHTISVRRELKLMVIAGYGGCCACCGQDDINVLTIDHVKPLSLWTVQDHQQVNGERNGLWLRAFDANCPPCFQLLCSHCNNLKGSKLECPHQTATRSLFLNFLNNLALALATKPESSQE
jgi:5-methylcytosine-specific restriction endonuclease McrA